MGGWGETRSVREVGGVAENRNTPSTDGAKKVWTASSCMLTLFYGTGTKEDFDFIFGLKS